MWQDMVKGCGLKMQDTLKDCTPVSLSPVFFLMPAFDSVTSSPISALTLDFVAA